MADNKTAQAAPSPAMSTEQMLATALTALSDSNAKIASLMEKQTDYNEFAKQNAPRRRVTMAEHLATNPPKRLLHEVYQNGRLVNPAGLSLATIKRLDTIATGQYCDGLVDVVRIKAGVNGLHSRIHIIYSNKSIEQRMVFYMRFPSFTKIVNDITDEMVAREIAPVNEPSADPVIEPDVVVS